MNYFDFEDCSIAYATQGKGNCIFLVHGFPTSHLTWRFLIPGLAKEFKVIFMDLPGLGESKCHPQADLGIDKQALRLSTFISSFNCEHNTIISHNSGGAISRLAALSHPKIKNLILINTEIPNHRPPWIPFYQRLTQIPLTPPIFRLLLRSKVFVAGPWGFQQLYFDWELFYKKGYLDTHLYPLKKSTNKIRGAFQFLAGIHWKMIDGLEKGHQEINAAVLLLWGEHDKTFPLLDAEKMMGQFKNVQIRTIPNSRLLPHEERPHEVLSHIFQFLNRTK